MVIFHSFLYVYQRVAVISILIRLNLESMLLSVEHLLNLYMGFKLDLNMIWKRDSTNEE